MTASAKVDPVKAFDAVSKCDAVSSFDAIVVGAGPGGSTAAEGLARAGLRVALLEEHAQVGLPDHCSGLVSPRTLELTAIPEQAVALRSYCQARVWGPCGGTLWLRSNSVQAIAIARDRFDQILAERAVAAGADLMLGTVAHRFARADGQIRVQVRTLHGAQQLRAPVLVGADGAASRVARWLGRGGRHEVIPAVKALATFAGPGPGEIEIFVGSDLAPGWFGWIIPLSGGRARLGLGVTGMLGSAGNDARFSAFLDLVRQRFGDFEVDGIHRAPIPLGPARDFVAEGVLLVGAAARQTKPTTGGGIYLAVRAGQMAAETAVRALSRGDTSRRALAAYETAWHRLEGHEVRVGGWLREAFRCLSDRELDWILATASEPWAQDAISHLGDIDFPAALLSALLRGVGRRINPLRLTEHPPLQRGTRPLRGEAR